VYSRLAWSPDGKWLAVAGEAELGQDGKVSLWILPPGGSDVHALGVGDQPVWSPDGTQLIYQSGGQNFGVKAGEWIPFPVTLPADSLVIDWVAVK
jgi:Tol biopolymer transport system component